MKQKLVFFIALALALTQGLAAQEPIGGGVDDLTAEHFSAYVGQQDTHTITLTYIYSTNPVAISSNGENQFTSSTLSSSNDFTVEIWDNDSHMFQITGSQITSFQTLTGQVKITATVEVTYSPTAPTNWRTHSATLHLLSGSGVSVASKNLVGEATVLKGDVNRDGLVNIADVSDLIDYLLSGDDSEIDLDAADVDEDGKVSVADVSELIDYILGVPDMMLCTFIIINKSDGSTDEYMINENTKINIVNSNLVVSGIKKPNGTSARNFTSPLENLSQLRYEERMVKFDKSTLMLMLSNEPEEEFMIEAESETLNTMQP